MKRMAALFIIFAVCVLLTAGCGRGGEVGVDTSRASYAVEVKINPDVIFIADENDIVVGVNTLNDEAFDVYINIAFSNAHICSVVPEWAEKCRAMGYDTHKTELTVTAPRGEIPEAVISVLDMLNATCDIPESEAVLSDSTDIVWFACPGCGCTLSKPTDLCPKCGHHDTDDTFTHCFCGAAVRVGTDLCPVCHLNSATGDYEDGWGADGQHFFYCKCGEPLENTGNGLCPVCRLYNYSGEYADSGTTCPACGGKGSVACRDCGGSGRTPCNLCSAGGLTEDSRCPACEGTGRAAVCCQCGTEYVLFPCGLCIGAGEINPCTVCGGRGKIAVCPDCGGVGNIGEPCENCGGSGACPKCGGTGGAGYTVEITDRSGEGTGEDAEAPCITCGGSGVCQTCHGSKISNCRTCKGKGRNIICPDCSGDGRYTCPDCGGTGLQTCPACGGTADSAVCSICGGTGMFRPQFINPDSCYCGGRGYYDCPNCAMGGVSDGWVECPDCGGSGRKQDA